MSENQKMVNLAEVIKGALGQVKQEKPTVYRYEIFKGEKDENGRIVKKKVVGSSYNRDGLKTYTVNLKTLLGDTFFLLPNTRGQGADFIILTREPGQNIGRKYFWNNVGEARMLDGVNSGVMQLSWDIFIQDLYMHLYPINVTELAEASRAEVAA